MVKKTLMLAPAHVILIPAWAIGTVQAQRLESEAIQYAGGYTTTDVAGAWRDATGKVVVEKSVRFEARVKMDDYAQDTRMERAFTDFATFLLTKENEVWRERGPRAWVEVK